MYSLTGSLRISPRGRRAETTPEGAAAAIQGRNSRPGRGEAGSGERRSGAGYTRGTATGN